MIPPQQAAQARIKASRDPRLRPAEGPPLGVSDARKPAPRRAASKNRRGAMARAATINMVVVLATSRARRGSRVAERPLTARAAGTAASQKIKKPQ